MPDRMMRLHMRYCLTDKTAARYILQTMSTSFWMHCELRFIYRSPARDHYFVILNFEAPPCAVHCAIGSTAWLLNLNVLTQNHRIVIFIYKDFTDRACRVACAPRHRILTSTILSHRRAPCSHASTHCSCEQRARGRTEGSHFDLSVSAIHSKWKLRPSILG